MVVGILQARYTSTRLPGKVLRPIVGKPMLRLQIERIRRAFVLDKLVVATSTDDTDAGIAALCEDLALDCYRGSLTDVLDRCYQAAQPYGPDYVVRLTGDCPLVEPALIDKIVDACRAGKYDYMTNALQPTFPDGLDVEVMTHGALQTAWREAQLASQREHVTLFIHQHPERFRVGHFKNDVDLSFLRWTVDEPLDLELVTEIYQSLYHENPAFTIHDVLRLLDRRPELKHLNLRFRRNEGLEASLRSDHIVRE